jgi:hypothetical protein
MLAGTRKALLLLSGRRMPTTYDPDLRFFGNQKQPNFFPLQFRCYDSLAGEWGH